MAKYKVLVIAHSLKNNAVALHGEVIDGSQLTSNADELVNAGFLELVEDEVTEIEVVSEVVPTPKAKKTK